MYLTNKKAPSAATLRAQDKPQPNHGKQLTPIVHPARRRRNGRGPALLAGAVLGAGILCALGAGVAEEEEAFSIPQSTFADSSLYTREPAAEEAHYPLSGEERALIEAVLMSECAYEPYAGQVAVAQCILDGCLYLDIRPDDCIRVYQYAEPSEAEPTQSVQDAVSAVFDDGYRAAEEDILFFYAPKWSSSPFHESQRFVTEIGGHRFFAMVG